MANIRRALVRLKNILFISTAEVEWRFQKEIVNMDIKYLKERSSSFSSFLRHAFSPFHFLFVSFYSLFSPSSYKSFRIWLISDFSSFQYSSNQSFTILEIVAFITWLLTVSSVFPLNHIVTFLISTSIPVLYTFSYLVLYFHFFTFWGFLNLFFVLLLKGSK